MTTALALVLALAQPDPAAAPPALLQAGIDEQLGAEVPRELSFVDQNGRACTLGELFDDRMPVVLVLAYYRCPMLCGLVVRGLADALGRLDNEPGRDYRVVTISFDPRDQPPAAERVRAAAATAFGRELDDAAWPFLVGEDDAIARLTEAVGFRYAWDATTEQYAHPAVAIVLTPSGTVARYLHGPSPEPLGLRLALLEAARGETATLGERVLVACYRYDPAQRRYAFRIAAFLQAGGVMLLLVLGGLGLVLYRHERRRARQERAS